MHVTCRTAKYAVLDDFMNKECMDAVWDGIQRSGHSSDMITLSWSRIWRWSGQPPVSGPEHLFSKSPFHNHFDIVAACFLDVANDLIDLIGPTWSDLRMHSQFGGRGVKTAWHLDSKNVGAFSYYPHPRWGLNWGGELMIANEPSERVGMPTSRKMEYEWEQNHLMKHGAGVYIAPLPNRCVVMAPNLFHSVARIDPDAGDAIRCCVVGFLQPEKEKP